MAAIVRAVWLVNKSPVMPAIHMDRFKNTFFNRIVFKYNVAL